ncbi:MAG TPA: LLM class flavin-dependent oxidoreductase [Solirubrobacteraceae bacterium]|jgi:alkanesulfonate monooxygenase SsuD/methylene tetrahydromethanopterin reductase-like flavin-dependent oxidoreductase (luciferase family)|nr:LLM class flavin-dependent oxidoreductase [Solirubrobacteraceae bacterium]
MKRGLFIAPFDELVDPRVVADLAVAAEERGWDGLFVWDHIAYRAPVRAVADPWIVLSAVASATRTLRIGPMVTPLARRRVQKLARETVTLDLLSQGRLTLGVGLGSDNSGELGPWGEELDPRKRAALLDDGLERLAQLWAGEFQPPPVQQPRIPVWVAARWPNRRPVRRAARWDGLFPIELPGPDALAELAAETREARSGQGAGLRDEPFDVVAEVAPGEDPAPWEAAGATWAFTDFGRQPRVAEVREAIAAGP